MHHIFSLLILGYVNISGRNGYVMLYFAFLGEITNPFLTVSEILEFTGAKKIYAIVCQAIFLVSFITIRCTIASWLVFETQTHPDVSFWFKLFPTLVIFQSYEWTFMMLNKVGKLVNDVSELDANITLRCSKETSWLKNITISSNF